MILWLCYIFPPLAIALMGRPFMSIGCMFVMLGGWRKGIRMALVSYADYKGDKLQAGIVEAVNNPAYIEQADPPGCQCCCQHCGQLR